MLRVWNKLHGMRGFGIVFSSISDQLSVLESPCALFGGTRDELRGLSGGEGAFLAAGHVILSFSGEAKIVFVLHA